MKKNIFIFIVSIAVFLSIKISSDNTSPSTQIVINTSPLKSIEIAKNIEKELSKIKGVSSYEVSLQSNILLVNYDDKQVDDKYIVGVLKKWGCDTYEISFNYLH